MLVAFAVRRRKSVEKRVAVRNRRVKTVSANARRINRKKCGESCCSMCNSTNTGCKCLAWETECGSICCGANQACSNGVCVCKDGREACDGVCCSEERECHKGTTCCDIIDKTKCPNGETMIASDGCEICKCDTGAPDVCPEETVRVKNYEGDIVCDKVCCKVKADYISYQPEGRPWYKLIGYTVVGAINGVCCGGYSSRYSHGVPDFYYEYDDYSYSINNNGTYYCAKSVSGINTNGDNVSYEHYYTSPYEKCSWHCVLDDDMGCYRTFSQCSPVP